MWSCYYMWHRRRVRCDTRSLVFLGPWEPGTAWKGPQANAHPANSWTGSVRIVQVLNRQLLFLALKLRYWSEMVEMCVKINTETKRSSSAELNRGKGRLFQKKKTQHQDGLTISLAKCGFSPIFQLLWHWPNWLKVQALMMHFCPFDVGCMNGRHVQLQNFQACLWIYS